MCRTSGRNEVLERRCVSLWQPLLWPEVISCEHGVVHQCGRDGSRPRVGILGELVKPVHLETSKRISYVIVNTRNVAYHYMKVAPGCHVKQRANQVHKGGAA